MCILQEHFIKPMLCHVLSYLPFKALASIFLQLNLTSSAVADALGGKLFNELFSLSRLSFSEVLPLLDVPDPSDFRLSFLSFSLPAELVPLLSGRNFFHALIKFFAKVITSSSELVFRNALTVMPILVFVRI